MKFIQFMQRPRINNNEIEFIGNPTKEEFQELLLEKKYVGYTTTLNNVASAGWDLAFVSPFSEYSNGRTNIRLLYTFKKEV